MTRKERYIVNNTDWLKSYVMQNLSRRAIEVLRDGRFDKAILENVGFCSVPLPLYTVTACNLILLDKCGGFLPLDDYVYKDNLEQCRELADFWSYEYGYDLAGFDFTPYIGDFFDVDAMSVHYDKMDDVDDVVALGYDRAEVELYKSVLHYDIEPVRKYLDLKINPNAVIYDDVPADKLNMAGDYLGESDSAVNNCINIVSESVRTMYGDYPDISTYWDVRRGHVPVDRDALLTLLHAAAYGRMYDLLTGSKR